VLAAVEADVRQTESLLNSPVVSGVASTLAPADLMLPAVEAPPLPPLDRMPPVPAELIDRITELRTRIGELQADLERCLAATRRPERIGARPLLVTPGVEQPRFVDRRV
jgi:hypothetical protein